MASTTPAMGAHSSTTRIWRWLGCWLLVGGWSLPLGLLLCELVSFNLPDGSLRNTIGPLLENYFLLFGIVSALARWPRHPIVSLLALIRSSVTPQFSVGNGHHGCVFGWRGPYPSFARETGTKL